MLSCSVVSDSFATPRTVTHQAPLVMGFTRHEYWSGRSFPSPEDHPVPGIESASPTLAGSLFTSWATREIQVRICTHLNRPVGFKMSLLFSSTEILTLWAGRPTAWSVGNDSRGSVIFSIKSLGASPESVGRSEPCSRTLILSTALSGNLHVVLNVWSGHQSQISGLRGRIGKWVYLWSEGFEGLVTLSSYTLCLSGAKALQRVATTVHLQDKMFLEQQRRISAHCVLGILM